MKNVIIASIMLLVCTLCYGQEAVKNLNFIIVIDDEIKLEYMTFLISSDKSDSKYQASYEPCCLLIAQSDYDQLMSDQSVDTVILRFNYNDFDLDLDLNNSYTYEIKLSKMLFCENYVILEIFNLNRKWNRKRFGVCAIGNRSKYVLQIRYPNGKVLSPPIRHIQYRAYYRYE